MNCFCSGPLIQKLVGGIALLMFTASATTVLGEFDVGGVQVSGSDGVTVQQVEENEFEAFGFNESGGTVDLLGEDLTAIEVQAKLSDERSTTFAARAGELVASTLAINPTAGAVSFQPTFTGGDSEHRTYSVLGYDSDGTLVGAVGRAPPTKSILVEFDAFILFPRPTWWDFLFEVPVARGECVWTVDLPQSALWNFDDTQVEVSRLVFVEDIENPSGQYTYLDFDGLEITTTAESLQFGQIVSH